MSELAARGAKEVGDGSDAGLIQAMLHAGADAVDVGQGEPMQNFGQGAWANDDEAVGLLHVAADFGEEDAGGEADGTGHARAEPLAEGLFDFVGEGLGGADFAFASHQAAGHFVDGGDFGDGQAGVDGFADAVVVLDIELMSCLNQHKVGASFFGFPDHRACFDAEGFGFIAGGDGAGAVGQHLDDGDGATTQFGALLLFAGREEAIEVEEKPVDEVVVGGARVHVVFLSRRRWGRQSEIGGGMICTIVPSGTPPPPSLEGRGSFKVFYNAVGFSLLKGGRRAGRLGGRFCLRGRFSWRGLPLDLC